MENIVNHERVEVTHLRSLGDSLVTCPKFLRARSIRKIFSSRLAYLLVRGSSALLALLLIVTSLKTRSSLTSRFLFRFLFGLVLWVETNTLSKELFTFGIVNFRR